MYLRVAAPPFPAYYNLQLTTQSCTEYHYILWLTPDIQRILVAGYRERNRFLWFFDKLLKNIKNQR